MNEKNEFLNEERYQKNRKKISNIAIVILIIGIVVGGSLIAVGLIKQNKVNSDYSLESKEKMQRELEIEKDKLESKKNELETKRSEALAAEKQKLETKKAELTAKGIKYDSFAKYDDGERYDLKIITDALDPSFANCAFDEYKNNALTSGYCLITNKNDEYSKNINVINEALDMSLMCAFGEVKSNSYTSTYCSLKNKLEEKTDFNKSFDSSNSIPFYMFGAFIIIASSIVAGSIYMYSKRREILAFNAQQVLPVAQEGIEKIAPTIGKAGANIAKEMAPIYGDIAKEISKGIKEGIKDETQEKNK